MALFHSLTSKDTTGYRCYSPSDTFGSATAALAQCLHSRQGSAQTTFSQTPPSEEDYAESNTTGVPEDEPANSALTDVTVSHSVVEISVAEITRTWPSSEVIIDVTGIEEGT